MDHPERVRRLHDFRIPETRSQVTEVNHVRQRFDGYRVNVPVQARRR
jgi:hypothetical protein